jgi:hypothetical protein
MIDKATEGGVNVRDLTYEEIVELYTIHGGERAAARHLGVPRTSLQAQYYRLKASRFQSRYSAAPLEYVATDEVQYFILSGAQDMTKVHTPFLMNLEAYAKKLRGTLMISGFTYSKRLFEEHDKIVSWYDPAIVPYLMQQRVNIGPGLTFCGEMNTLPTAVQPLSGFESYTRDRWGIFPHPKVHLRSIPTAKADDVKMILTTGSVTLPNYVQKKAGIKAEFTHEVGAVIVELMPNGTFFVRHLLADEDGSFYDLNKLVANGKVVEVQDHIEGVTWGDVHREKFDPVISGAIWGTDQPPAFEPMLDFLKPRHQFLHDVIDFTPRNHHNIKDPHFIYKMHVQGSESVEETLRDTASFVQAVLRPGTKTVIVESNHDLALLRWLKSADYREDPVNARFFLKMQNRIYDAIFEGDDKFQPLPWVLKEMADLEDVVFLSEDDSFIIAGGIECGMHGHNGSGGRPGTATQFSKMGKRSNTAHTHSAAIWDGAYVAGVSGDLDMGYNKGLSPWSHSHVLTYVNGKRTILTQHRDGVYCAEAYEQLNG